MASGQKHGATTVVHPFDPGEPTGLHVVARQLVAALTARGGRVRVVLPKPDALGGLPDGVAIERHDSLGGEVDICWLPADTFDPGARHRLYFALERMAEDTARWACFGIGASAFVGSLVARRSGTPCATFVASRDVLGRSMMHPEEIAATLARSRRVFCGNGGVIDLLAASYEPEMRALVGEERLAVMRPECEATSAGAVIAKADHICTTGALGLYEDVAELTSRAVDEMRANAAKRWVHVGTIHPRVAGNLASALASRGLTGAFEATGRIAPSEYETLLRSSLCLLKPRGEVDTGLSIAEAHRWGVRVSLPAHFPFSADGNPRADAMEPHLRVVEGADLATLVLEP